MSVRPATTILLLRPADEGFEIFMVQRNRRSGFLPNAWVFPGGRVDESDAMHGHPRILGGREVLGRMGVDAQEAAAFLIAGVRETFEEAGIWLGSGDLPWELREPLGRGELPLADVLDKHDAHVDLDLLYAWSWWITPEIEKRRFDTRFLVATSPSDHGEHDGGETVNSGWFNPREVMAKAAHGDFPMAPPTWWTLFELSAHDTVQAVLNAAHTRPVKPIQPLMKFDDSGIHLILPGHPDHPVDAVEGMPTLVEFEDGGWVAYVGGERLVVPGL